MTLSSLRLALIAGVAAPLALASAAVAQPASSAPAPEAAGHRWRDPAEMRAHIADHLRAILQLQPSQDAALNAFLDSMKPPAGDHDRVHDAGETGERLTTPQRLDQMLARLDERRNRMVQIASATKTFYAQLSSAQQRAFDALPMGHGFDHARHDMDGGRGDGRDGPHEMGPDGPPHG